MLAAVVRKESHCTSRRHTVNDFFVATIELEFVDISRPRPCAQTQQERQN